MSWSIGEIAALSVKAARGAGKPWGLAEEAGRAVRWLSAQRLPGPEALAGALRKTRGLCPITIGVTVSDQWSPASLGGGSEIAQPLLVLPFLALISPMDGAFRITIGNATALVTRNGTELTGNLPDVAPVRVVKTDQRPLLPSRYARVDYIAPKALSTLEEFAALTYAPATDESRHKGAGAGLTDND
jgi:hypothetical protein